MKAYKCDICGHYCDDVFTIHGITAPISHAKYYNGESFDCCERCYDEIMRKISDMKSGKEETHE